MQGQGHFQRSPRPLQLAELRPGLFPWRQDTTRMFPLGPTPRMEPATQRQASQTNEPAGVGSRGQGHLCGQPAIRQAPDTSEQRDRGPRGRTVYPVRTEFALQARSLGKASAPTSASRAAGTVGTLATTGSN